MIYLFKISAFNYQRNVLSLCDLPWVPMQVLPVFIRHYKTLIDLAKICDSHHDTEKQIILLSYSRMISEKDKSQRNNITPSPN